MTIHFFNGKSFSMLIGGLAIALFGVLNVAAQAVTFSGKHLQTGGQYQVAGDFNGDGRQDLASAGLDVEIMLGLGDGNFQTSLRFPLVIGTAESPLSIIKGDFNGDGKFDLAVSLNASNQVAVLLGNGDGTFQPQARYSSRAKQSRRRGF